MKKIFAILIASIILSGCTMGVVPNKSNLETISIDNHEFQVEVRRTPDELAQGLSGRTEIGSDGMLFYLPQRQVASFWMKDMLFAIDMVWIDDEKVVDISSNVPFPNPEVPLNKLPTYSPKQPVTLVLELDAGGAERFDIKIGSLVVLK
ncbi:MAG: hypothetical protein COY80_00190 [Candidatus Pacebacteria bacterium CG_4_10_14_0_8_um_filter_42_14]|nr:MAG: hypothetical protein COY80_00190 [Candidatus Pacebacteria bacterium CG_4_10_14_0_8_um_filter_42_14]